MWSQVVLWSWPSFVEVRRNCLRSEKTLKTKGLRGLVCVIGQPKDDFCVKQNALTEGRLWKIGKLARMKRAFVRVAVWICALLLKGFLFNEVRISSLTNGEGKSPILQLHPKNERGRFLGLKPSECTVLCQYLLQRILKFLWNSY